MLLLLVMLRSDYEKWADCRASQLKGHLKVTVLVTQSRPALCNPMDYSLCAWTSPGKNIGMGSLSLLQGIFLIQGSNPGLPHCKQILYHLSHQGNPQRTFSYQVLGPLGFIHGMASFRLLLIRPLENSASLATLRQPEVSPRTPGRPLLLGVLSWRLPGDLGAASAMQFSAPRAFREPWSDHLILQEVVFLVEGLGNILLALSSPVTERDVEGCTFLGFLPEGNSRKLFWQAG